MSAIPTRAREIVRERQQGACARCGNRYTALHHRQRRREAGHGVEILVGVCATCHDWAHKHPEKARESGYSISPHEEDAAAVPLKSYMGWVVFDDAGNMTLIEEN